MGYHVVAVNPLKPFPIVSLGLANVASFDDAKGQILAKFKKMAQMRIDASDAFIEINGGQKLNGDGRAEIFKDYEKAADEAFSKFEEERWPKIGPALKPHLARQERRKKHFESACRLEGCDNPHPLGTLYNGVSRALGRVAHRHNVPLFCGAHAYLRRAISAKAKKELIANSSKRLAIS